MDTLIQNSQQTETNKIISTRHLRYLSDDFGIWQHTVGEHINKDHGYALDDSARGLIVAIKYYEIELAEVYFNFIENACLNYKSIINFFDEFKNPVSQECSEDAIGEVYWAMCYCVSKSFYSSRAKKIIHKLLPLVNNFTSPRGKAYTILGSIHHNEKFMYNFCNDMINAFYDNSTKCWQWSEKYLTYANAILPWALYESSLEVNNLEAQEIAVTMLDFLNKTNTYNDVPIAIGNNGWYQSGGELPLYSQQPIDVAYQVIANARINKFDQSAKFMSWFWGNNLAQTVMIDIDKHYCFDGFDDKSVSINCGSENIICYLLAQEIFEINYATIS